MSVSQARYFRKIKYGGPMLLQAGAPRPLGDTRGSRLRFVEASKGEGAWAGRRLLLLDDQPAFELSFWCGTCPCVFQRLEGANSTFSPAEGDGSVSGKADGIDEQALTRFGRDPRRLRAGGGAGP